MTQLDPITRVVRAGVNQEALGDVVPPIHLSTTFAFQQFGQTPDYDYSRAGNPTRDLLGQAVADLEGGVGGVVTASGMGAITAVLAACVPAGAVVAAPHDCYGGTWRLLDALAAQGHLQLRLLDFTDAAALPGAIGPDITAVFVESPSNPLLRVTDIAQVCALAQAAGALTVVDNTFATPVFQRPLEMGAEVVVRSATQY
ncbi:MAG: aminotransferase class I/II-fold pyridoxal phosphate-dependent enzyme, partial [Propionibacteriaceae bacterium]|nr:aminotransferase class I/II-fold pyridoxal phosphate-dependent enzyme [Propionibacteriaceae bacterium]